MANVLLGVTGSVAAIKTPDLYAEFTRRGHQVRVVATKASTYFFDPASIGPRPGRRDPKVVTLDEDEWPGSGYQRGDEVLHIELRRWAELLVIAPLDANTLAKLAAGLCDNCLTCVWRCWDPDRPVVLAPAMNTLMWRNPLTARHLGAFLTEPTHSVLPPEEVSRRVNDSRYLLQIVGPISKELACGDVGIGAMAEVSAVADACETMLGRGRLTSP